MLPLLTKDAAMIRSQLFGNQGPIAVNIDAGKFQVFVHNKFCEVWLYFTYFSVVLKEIL